jgi:hypothetical protein
VNLLLDQVAVPGAQAVVVDGDALAAGVVVELNFVCDVHADGVADQRFAGFNLYKRPSI